VCPPRDNKVMMEDFERNDQEVKNVAMIEQYQYDVMMMSTLCYDGIGRKA